MKQICLIAAAEWRYWLRSYLVVGGALIFTVLVIATSVLTTVRMDEQTHARQHQQSQAEDTFLAQPDRHPHRMVHYGHYVFRAPAPLAIFDPGLDSVTGQSIFLEGHRQNTAMFAPSAASADLGGLSGLTPALVYQLFAPLLIILLGYSSIVREREAAVLASLLALGVNGRTLILGKVVALLSFSLLLLIPLAISGIVAVASGENSVAPLALLGFYLTYFVVWVCMIVCVSAVFLKRSTTLAVLTGLWFSFTLVLPSIAVNIATNAKPLAGKIETDLKMLADLSKLGDGHNANDPAFLKLRADLLKKYKVEDVKDLPVNFRGIVAAKAEEKLTKVLNNYAQLRMSNEAQQKQLLTQFSWLSPTVAIAFASRSVAGTDLAHYHRFQKEAEALRFDFVQGLNRAHVQELSYKDDINRNKDEQSWLKARVDSTNWQVLNNFNFQPAPVPQRLTNAFQTYWVLLVWLVASLVGLFYFGGRINP